MWVVSETSQQCLFNELHDTHPGIGAIKRLARTLFCHPGWDNDIERLVKGCPQCVQCWSMPAAQVPSPWPKTGKRWYRLHMDFASPVDDYLIFILVDAGTKCIKATPAKTATTDTAAQRKFRQFWYPAVCGVGQRPPFLDRGNGKVLYATFCCLRIPGKRALTLRITPQ